MAFHDFLLVRAVWCGLVFGSTAASGFTLNAIDPVSGLPGTTVTVSGTFDSTADYTIIIGDTAAPTVSKTESALTFSVPVGATTAEVKISDGTGNVIFPTPFVVLREITGRFVPPAGLNASAYYAGTAADVRGIDNDGTFAALVEAGLSSAVIVFRENDDPAFVSLVTSTEGTITVDAATTAESLVIGSPLLAAETDAAIELFESRLRASDDYAALVARVELAAGGDYLKDASLDDLLVSLILEMSNAPEPREVRGHLGEPFRGSKFVRTIGVELRELNPDPKVTNNPIIRHEMSLESFIEDDPEDIDQLVFSYGRARDTRLDWSLTVRELDPFQFPNGFADIAALDGNDPKSAPVPLDSGFVDAGWVRAKLFSSKFDVLKGAINAARDALLGGLEKEAALDGTADFTIPNEPDKIYMATGTSGNFWYGTDWVFIGKNNQESSIEKTGAELQWELSAASNVVLAAVDAASVFLKINDVAGVGGGYIKASMKSVLKTISAYRGGSDAFTEAAMYELVKNLATDLSKEFAAAQAKSLPEKAARYSVMAAKNSALAAKSLDLLGKLSSAGQALERTGTLFSPGTLAMERAILIVGDPFSPQISSIFPLQGRVGSEVTITGVNLAQPGVASVVTFCKFPESIPRGEEPEPDPSVLPLAAEILEAFENRVTIRVPEGFAQRFGTFGAHICLTKITDQETDSYRLGDDGKFTLIPPPEATGFDPPPEADGGVVTLLGTHFAGMRPAVEVNGQPVGVSTADDTSLVITLPPLTPGQDHILVVTIEGESSEPLIFQVPRPAHVPQGLGPGPSITITSPSMNNVADDEISIKEAFLLAIGGLGRNLSDDEERLVPNWIDAGANRAETISFDTESTGMFISLTEPLPPIGRADRIRGRGVTLVGEGAPAGSDGMVLDGISDAEVSDLILTGWNGDGIRVTNGSSGNTFRNVTVSAVGATGVYIDNESNFNSFIELEVIDCDGDGISISGLSHHNSLTSALVTRVDGNGVRLSDRADHNHFYTLTISECNQNGIFLDGEAIANRFTGAIEISAVDKSGIVLSGAAVRNNGFYQITGQSQFPYFVMTAVRDCSE